MKKILFTVGATLLATTVFAGEGYDMPGDNTVAVESQPVQVVNPYDNIGPYLGASLGFGEGGKKGGSRDAGMLWGLHMGYQYTPVWASEVGFLNIPSLAVSGGHISGNSYLWTFLAKGSMPLPNQFSAFAKGGIALVHHTSSVSQYGIDNNKPALYVGGGVSYHVSPIIDITSQLFGTLGDGTDTTTWGLLAGIEYHFQM